MSNSFPSGDLADTIHGNFHSLLHLMCRYTEGFEWVERDDVTVMVCEFPTRAREEMGGCTVELTLNGEMVDSVEIPSFGGGVTATQFFELTRGKGTYEVEVEGLTGSFTVFRPEASFWDKIPGFPYVSIIIGLIVVIIVSGSRAG